MSELPPVDPRPWHRRPPLLVGLGVSASVVFVAAQSAQRKETHARRDIALGLFGVVFPYLVLAIIVAVFLATFRLPSA